LPIQYWSVGILSIEPEGSPGPDAADSYATEIHILDRNPGGQTNVSGQYDQHNEECQNGN